MLPQYTGKHDRPAIVTPEQYLSYQQDQRSLFETEPPSSAVLLYQPTAMTHVEHQYEHTELHGVMGDAYRLESGEQSVAVVGNFGIGGPATAAVVEVLIAWGVERFLIAGAAGALQPSLSIGDVIIVDRAIRDEGTSHHYLPSDRTVDAADALTAALEQTHPADVAETGTTWTTDAIYRETDDEVTQYRQDGVLTVDMEAASLFAIAEYRDVEAGAIVTISDAVTAEDWDPQFHQLSDRLATIADTAISVCETAPRSRNR